MQVIFLWQASDLHDIFTIKLAFDEFWDEYAAKSILY